MSRSGVCSDGCCSCTSSGRRDLQPGIQAMWDAHLAVKVALEAGASANACPGVPCPPIVVATLANDEGMVDALLEKGADPDKPITVEAPFLSLGVDFKFSVPGERALHVAARRGNVEIVRLLLQRSRAADPNATDNEGCTPLVRTCACKHVCVEVVRLLLEAGADPTLAEERGSMPLHLVALKGHMDVVDMLYTSAPATLNHCTADGITPLYAACSEGHESMVCRLLSLGAMQPLSTTACKACPLFVAVHKDFVGVVRILINERGIRAVGGEEQVPKALMMAILHRQSRILRLLLTVDGDEKKLANTVLEDGCVLHYCAAYCYTAGVSVLLEMGADEALCDLKGFTPRDVIGLRLSLDGGPQVDGAKELATRLMLERGPAYRARSWAWPSDEEAGVGGSYDFAAAVAAAALSSPPALNSSAVFGVAGVRIFRSKEKNSNSKLFVKLVGRYCAGP